MTPHIEGLIAAPFTPLTAAGALKLDVVPAYANLLHRNGVVGAFVCGSTGEGVSLTTAERRDVTRAWVAAAPAGFKVLVHVGHTSIEDSKALAADAQAAGAHGVATMAPLYFKPATAEALAVYCAEIAAAAPRLPFYFYHIPSMTGVHLPVADLLRVAAPRIPNLAGAKFTYENLMDYQECLALEHGRYDMLFGRDEILLCGLALGARGGVGSTYNFAAPLYRNIIAAFDRGNLAEARCLQMKSVALIEFILKSGLSFLAASKAIMGMLGVECGPVRLPLAALDAAQIAQLRAGLERLGFFEFACQ
jgi:N-acetylneuraminate lyase